MTELPVPALIHVLIPYSFPPGKKNLKAVKNAYFCNKELTKVSCENNESSAVFEWN
jgi:hypothetical protein